MQAFIEKISKQLRIPTCVLDQIYKDTIGDQYDDDKRKDYFPESPRRKMKKKMKEAYEKGEEPHYLYVRKHTNSDNYFPGLLRKEILDDKVYVLDPELYPVKIVSVVKYKDGVLLLL